MIYDCEYVQPPAPQEGIAMVVNSLKNLLFKGLFRKHLLVPNFSMRKKKL